MKTLSLRQPWAWLVVHGGKTIENRRWGTRFRGEFLIHAAKGMTAAEYFDAVQWTAHRGHEVAGRMPPAKELARGGVIGIARLDGVLRPGTVDHAPLLADRADVDVRWHMHEQHGFVLRDVRPTPFIPCVGALGFFEAPDSVTEKALRYAGHTWICVDEDAKVCGGLGLPGRGEPCDCACHATTGRQVVGGDDSVGHVFGDSLDVCVRD